MLNQISVGRLFSDDNPYLVPLNEYVTHATAKFSAWFYDRECEPEDRIVLGTTTDVRFSEYLTRTLASNVCSGGCGRCRSPLCR